MNLSSRLRALLPAKRCQRRLLDASLIVAVILGAQYWQARGLRGGAAPLLPGMLTDGSQVPVPGGTQSAGGDTATLVAFWATWCPVCSAEEGNIVSVAKDHRVVGYTTTWGLKARLWWAESFPA